MPNLQPCNLVIGSDLELPPIDQHITSVASGCSSWYWPDRVGIIYQVMAAGGKGGTRGGLATKNGIPGKMVATKPESASRIGDEF